MADWRGPAERHPYPSWAWFEAQAAAELAGIGLDLPGMPAPPAGCLLDNKTGEVIDFPVDLDQVHSDDLGRWMGALSAWVAYGRGQLGVAEAIRVDAGRKASRRQSDVEATSTATKVTDRRLEAKTDREYRALRDIEEDAHRRAKLLDGRVEGLVDLYKAVSREVTRRTGNAGQGRHFG